MRITENREKLSGLAQSIIGGYFLLLISLELPKTAGDLAQESFDLLVESDAKVDASTSVLVRDLQPALQNADRIAQERIEAAKKVLQLKLGDRWTPAHKEAGYSKPTLEMPSTMKERSRLLKKMGNFFEKNAAWQSTDLGVTSVNLLTSGNALSSALAAVDAHSAAHKKLVKARDAAEAQLRSRLCNLINEVRHVLPADDVRWAELGIKSPAEERATREERAEQQKRTAEVAAASATAKKLETTQRKLEAARIKSEKARGKAERTQVALTAAQNNAVAAAEEVIRLEAELRALGRNPMTIGPGGRLETPATADGESEAAASETTADGLKISALVA